MSQLPLCPHCLEPVRSGYHGSCPNCGKSLENHNPEGALPLGTKLGGHYTVNTRAPTATACATAVWIMMNVGLC